eukprot:5935837-Karenia_brevis.AAC.1
MVVNGRDLPPSVSGRHAEHPANLSSAPHTNPVSLADVGALCPTHSLAAPEVETAVPHEHLRAATTQG